jgi:hypothetical protein
MAACNVENTRTFDYKIGKHFMNETKTMQTSIGCIQLDGQDLPASPFSPFNRMY